LLVEPGAAVAVAAYRKLATRELIHPGETTVIVLTGHGLKDPDALRFALGTNNDATVIDPEDVEALGAALEVHG
jgi:threonine synthase